MAHPITAMLICEQQQDVWGRFGLLFCHCDVGSLSTFVSNMKEGSLANQMDIRTL